MMHIFSLKENLENIKDLLRKVNHQLKEVHPTHGSVEKFLDYIDLKVSWDELINKGDWKIYRIYKSFSGQNYVEFEYFCRTTRYMGEAGPDFHFGEELKELSSLTDKDIYYIWSQHIDEGYEVYKNGKCINSVILDTHGPRVEVNGKAIKQSIWRVGFVNYRKITEKNSLVPKEMRGFVDSRSYQKLSSEFAVFIRQNISDFETLVPK